MQPATALLVCAGLSVVVAYMATPAAIRLADRLDFYDRPQGYKKHGRATPYLGGLAVMAAFVVAVAVLATDASRTLPIVGGTLVLCAVGTVDDKRHLSPLLRVVVEVGLATMLFALDLRWELGLGSAVDWAVTVVWIVAVVNAFNLFDNMDGAASTMGAVVSAGLAVLGLVREDLWLAGTAAALAGACLGFLPHNLASPSRIFLGDGGSMPVGFAVAALAMVGAAGSNEAFQALAMGVLLVGIPALDTMLVIVSRKRRGIPVLTGGRDHLTHRTRKRLRTARGVALALGGAQAMLGVLAVLAVNGGSGVLVAAVLAYLIGVGTTIALLDGPPGAAAAGIEHGDVSQKLAGDASLARRLLAQPDVLLAPALGLAIGLSLFGAGLYAPSRWVPVALAALVLLVSLAVSRPVHLRVAAWGALLALSSLALWAMASSLWAHSSAQALVEANRLVLYAAVLGVLLLVVRDQRRAVLALGALTAGLAGVAAWVLWTLLAGSVDEVLVVGRLFEPLGSINAEGIAFVMAVFPCLALAEQARMLPASVRGAAAGLAALFCGLAFMSQARSVALGAAVGLLAILVLLPGRSGRLLLVSAVLVPVAAAALILQELPSAGTVGTLDAGLSRQAAGALILATLAAGGLWAWAATVERRLTGDARARVERATRRGFAVAGVLAVALAVLNAGAIADGVSDRYDAFVTLRPEAPAAASGTSRLLAGGGNHYDRWRVGVEAFRANPVGGVGAGNFDVEYFERRRTAETLRHPQSLQVQTLAELGIVGLALLLVVFAAVVVAVIRRRAEARTDPVEAALLLAGAGAGAAWLAHVSVDWTHLLPGVSAGALVAVAVLLRRGPVGEPPPVWVPKRVLPATAWLRPTGAALLAALVVVGGATLSRQALADMFREDARAALQDGRPGDAIVSANRSLRLDRDSLPTYYVKAAGLARFNEARAAESVLLDAAAREPRDFLTYVLLGDLAVRRGDEETAGRWYRRAAALNPRDAAIQALARDPRAG